MDIICRQDCNKNSSSIKDVFFVEVNVSFQALLFTASPFMQTANMRQQKDGVTNRGIESSDRSPGN